MTAGKPLKKAGIVLFLSFALLVLVEAALRILSHDPAPGSPAFRFDEECLVSLEPGREKTFVRSTADGGDAIRWRTNESGFRGPELDPDPSKRVIVYGDSNVLARFSRLENTYCHRLKGYLAESGLDGVEVVNAGVVGSGPDQSLIRFSREAGRLRPDLVVFHVFADNDFGDLFRNRLLELNDRGDLVRTTHPRKVDSVLAPSFLSSLMLSRVGAKLAEKLSGGDPGPRMLEQIRGFVERDFEVYERGMPRVVSHFMDYYDLDVATEPESESAGEKVRLLRAVLAEAGKVAARNGAGFLVVVQPSSVDLTEHLPLNHRFLQRLPGYDRQNLSRAAEDVCREEGVPCLNLFETFLENGPEDLFFKSDSHWNDRGQDLAARETADFITREIPQWRSRPGWRRP